MILRGSPQQIVQGFLKMLLPGARHDDYIIVVSIGTHLIVYRGTKRLRAFPLTEKAGQLPAGIFDIETVNGQDLVMQMGRDRQGRLVHRGVGVQDPQQRSYNAIPQAQLADFLALMRSGRKFVILRSGSTGKGNEGGGGDGGGEKSATEEGSAEGAGAEGGETAPPIPDWAQLAFRVVRDRVNYEKRHVRELAGKGAGEGDDKAIERLLVLAGVPSRVQLGSDGKVPLISVEVPGNRKGALALVEGQGPGLLWERVQTLARVLSAGKTAKRDASPQEMMLGLPGDGEPDPNTVAPNKEAYPSELQNLGPAVGISGSVHRFQMNINWAVDGEFANFAAFGPRGYRWDIFQLRTAAGELGAADKSRRVGRGQAAGSELKGGFSEIGEDVEASVQEEIIDPATGTAIAVDAAVRSIGTLVKSFVSLASTPTHERGVKWEGPGTYVVRCVSARPPLSREDAPANPVVRAPSVAFYTIKVMSAKDMATQLTAPGEMTSAETKLAELTAKLDKATGDDRAALEEEIREQRAEIERLRVADETETGAHLDALDAQTDEQIAMTQMVADLRKAEQDEKKWGPLIPANTPALLKPPKMTADLLHGQVVGLHVQLTLTGRQPATVIEELRRVSEQTRKQRGALRDVAGEMQGPRFRPHMSFVPRSGGRALPLLIVLGEAAGSTEGNRTWMLFDLSTPGHHDPYKGTSSAAGPAGHAEAISRAIRDFVEDVPYGRGTVGVRLSDTLRKYVGTEINVASTIDAKPGKSKRWESRLESIATAAATAALLVTGPVGVALGIVGGIAGGVVAAHRIHRRYEGGYLELDLATAMDITAIVGAALPGLGAAAGSVRAGATSLGTATKWVRIAGRVERGIEVFGYLQLGSQIFVIPVTLAMELQAIAKDPNLSPGERAAKRALAFLGAMRAGLESIGTAYQLRSEHVQVTDAPAPEMPTIRPTETTTRPAEVTTKPTEKPVHPGETPTRPSETPTRPTEGQQPAETPVRPDESGTRPSETTRPTEAPTRPNETTTRPEPSPGEETVGPGARTASGTAGGEPPQRTGPGVDANPAGRARAVEVIEQRLRSGRPRQPEKSPQKVTQKDFDARPTSADEALAIYDRVVAQSGGNEVGLFYNPNTGEFAVRVGTEFSVSPPPHGEGWQAIVHLHPNPENVIIRRMPAPADVMGAVRAAFRTGSHTEYVQFVRPDGTIGYSRVEVTTHPPRIVVELPGEPASRGHAGEPPRTIEVTTPEAYAREYGSDTSHLDPTSALYRWIMRDLDAFYAARRSGQTHDAGEGRTAAGTVMPAPDVSGTAPPGGSRPPEAPAGPGFRTDLEARRPDIQRRFMEADVEFVSGEGEGVALSARFDTAMSTLERARHGTRGPRGSGAFACSPAATRKGLERRSACARVVEAMQQVAEQVLVQRPDLVTPDQGQRAVPHSNPRARRSRSTHAFRERKDPRGHADCRPRSLPELADAMRRMNRAVDEQAGIGDPRPSGAAAGVDDAYAMWWQEGWRGAAPPRARGSPPLPRSLGRTPTSASESPVSSGCS